MLSFFLSSSSSPSSWVIKYQRLSVKLILFILLWRLRGCRDFGSVGTCPDLAFSITSMTRQLFAWNNPLVWRSIKERYWKDKVGGEKFTRSIIIKLVSPQAAQLGLHHKYRWNYWRTWFRRLHWELERKNRKKRPTSKRIRTHHLRITASTAAPQSSARTLHHI